MVKELLELGCPQLLNSEKTTIAFRIVFIKQKRRTRWPRIVDEEVGRAQAEVNGSKF
jgi:hypothetical protein